MRRRKTYVTGQEYDSTLKAHEILVKQGGTADNKTIRPWQNKSARGVFLLLENKPKKEKMKNEI